MGDQRSGQRLLPLLLLLTLLARLSQLWAFPFSPSLDLDVTPRTTVFSEGLLGSVSFTGSSRNYSTLLLEEDSGLLYVGGRGVLHALNTTDISTTANLTIDWDASPEQKKQCLNKGRDNQTQCYNHIRFLQRFNESHLYVCGTNAFRPLCAYIDSERFSLSSGFEEGRDRCPYDPAKGFTGLLVEADFVGSVLLKESFNSSIGDDDKIYFFFTERSQEQIAYPSQTKVSRVARVCKYAFSDVQRAFDGPFMEVQDSKWREYTGKVPEPRPGSCITDVHRSHGINSSRDLPDNVLTFARRHPLMASQVHPIGVRPLMFKRSVNYVKIVVHKEPALDGNTYTVLFLGTVVHRRRSVMAGDDVLLQCELRSNLAAPRWTLNGKELQGYDLNSGYRVGTDGLLIIGARAQQSGSYRCFALENSVAVLIYLYTVRVHTDSYFPVEPIVVTNPATASSTTVSSSGLTERPLPSPPAPRTPGAEFQTYRHMEAVYISLVAVLGGLCLVLTVVLLYVSFCTRRASRSRKFSQQGLHVLGSSERKRSSHMELKTISSHYNGRQSRRSTSVPTFGDLGDSFLQIVPGEDQFSPCKTPPPAPPLPMPPPLPNMDYANGLSDTLPSVLRKMNGNSYVLLRQVDPDGVSPLYHSFTEELNRILEQRKHVQLDLQPDESSI
ncbi:Semaphorin-4G [Liparis tanakae]|uniref:Semaphorin-4G n=1 Tax=Liparis tanakae TaxID=230148 RepID=A0A4Z2J3B8_9TELE|nr:Semaphorin-4G [Liparis tanakae]